MRAFLKNLVEDFIDPDKALMGSTSALIEAVGQRHALGLSPEMGRRRTSQTPLRRICWHSKYRG